MDYRAFLMDFTERTDFYFPRMRVLPRRTQLATLAVLAAAGLFYATKYINMNSFVNFSKQYLLEGLPSSDESWHVPGLQNFGNNCFLNVILQALSSSSSFRRYLQMIFEEFGFSSIEERDEKLPIASALASVLERLCRAEQVRSVISPQDLMFELRLHLPNFNLAIQQDAEEALVHLLSCLRNELRICNIINRSSLADVNAECNRRVLTPKLGARESEQQIWEHFLLGPFDGMLGDILFCQSCSSQISLEFEFFHSLRLSPPFSRCGIIIPGCSIENCLKHFFFPERLENYFCNYCWHESALKYLLYIGECGTDFDILLRCNKDNSCCCKDLFSLRLFPWSNNFSRSFKQLTLARSPQILCIQLQRASFDNFGQLVKLQGHISFPLILDMSRFVDSSSISVSAHSRHQQQLSTNDNALFSGNPGTEKEGECSNEHMYRLVSVVEHWGTIGNGHYIVYKRVEVEIADIEDPTTTITRTMWFSISDSEVSQVSDTDVLRAEPTLLFYEKISDFESHL